MQKRETCAALQQIYSVQHVLFGVEIKTLLKHTCYCASRTACRDAPPYRNNRARRLRRGGKLMESGHNLLYNAQCHNLFSASIVH